MKLRKFNISKWKTKRFISLVGVLFVIGSIVLLKSYAFYEEKKIFNVLKGRIPDFGYDIKMLSVVVDGEKKENIPERGLYKTQIDCTNSTTGKWDYNAWNLILENVSEQAKCNITFTTNGITEEEQNALIEEGKTKRRNTYRGKDITNYYRDGSLYTMISSGRFDDIYVGDYINANEVTWLIADIDNYLYSGDNTNILRKHHATIIPAKPLTNSQMNETATTEGGYVESKMVTTTLPQILETYIKPTFGSHIITYRNLLTNKVNKNAQSIGMGWMGSSTGWDWYDRQLDLMGEANVFGINTYSSSAYDIGADNQQYAIFQLKPEYNLLGTGANIHWL